MFNFFKEHHFARGVHRLSVTIVQQALDILKALFFYWKFAHMSFGCFVFIKTFYVICPCTENGVEGLFVFEVILQLYSAAHIDNKTI